MEVALRLAPTRRYHRDMAGETIFIINLATTWFLVGLIWFVQVVHYPLYSSVGAAAFLPYHRDHMRRTTWVVAPVMLAEAVSALLLIWVRPESVSLWVALVGMMLVLTLWASTAVLQVPAHQKLSVGFRGPTHRLLVASNWIRTFAWSARGVLLLFALP